MTLKLVPKHCKRDDCAAAVAVRFMTAETISNMMRGQQEQQTKQQLPHLYLDCTVKDFLTSADTWLLV